VQDADSRLHLVQYASTQIEATMNEAREAVAGLRTAKQTSAGLVDSVRRMTEKSSREHGVESNLVVIGEPLAMNPHTSHSLTMVVREAVFNAILHANTQTISIKLSFSADALRIEVADDGQGFVVAASRPEEHHGQLRLPGHPDAEQDLGAGTGAMPVPRPSREPAAARQLRHGDKPTSLWPAAWLPASADTVCVSPLQMRWSAS
jgi:anti-sigma regulatory factor (Ser/Thr protein kinase)